MRPIPFLKPRLVSADELLPFLRRLDESRIYSNFGPLNCELEKRILAEHFAGRGAVTTVHNATTGLMLAIQAAKRPKGRFAVMPSFTFAATPQAALWCGLEPYFVDIRPDDFCADEALVAQTVRSLGEEVAVVIPYATFGTACDLAFYESLQAAGIPVVVDAAASFGSTTSAGQFGTGFTGSVVFSFHATKSFGIGEGGLVYSADQSLVEHIRRAGNFGFSDSRESEFQGLNGKLSEYAAAVGLATLEQFQSRIVLRQKIHGAYVDLMNRRGMFLRGWRMQRVDGSVAYQFVCVVCPAGRHNSEFVQALAQRDIQVRTYFSPVCHAQKAFSGATATTLATTDMISGRVLSLPLWEDIRIEDIESVVTALDAA